jgi:type I restriction enzyme S subunit
MSDLTLSASTRPIDLKELPQDWRAMQLKDFCTFVQGGRLGLTKQDDYRPSGVPAFSAAGQDGYVDITEFLNTDAVVLSAIGANCGRCFIATGDWTTLANVQVVIPDPNEANARFLHYRVNRDDYWPRSGSAQPFIKPSDIKTCWIALPPATQQVAIVQVLDTLESAIQETEAIIAKLKAVKQGLLHDLLTRGIDANGELRPPQAQAPHVYKESPLGWIPQDWRVLRLEEIAQVSRGKFTHRPRNDPRFYGGQHPFIQTGDVAAAEGEYVSTFSQTLSDRGASVSQEFPAGSIAITIAANIADTAILAIPMFFPDSVVGAIVNAEHNIRFVELSIRRAKRVLDARAPQSAQKNINLQDLRPLQLTAPGRNEQNEIAVRYESLQSQLQLEVQTLAKYRHARVGLMEDLLTGRVRVTPLLAEASHQPGSK